MIIDNKVIEYSKYYFKQLGGTLDKSPNIRLSIYLPLYLTINDKNNKNKEIPNHIDKHILNKFTQSMTSHYKLIEKTPKLKEYAITNIKNLMVEHNISSDDLHKEYNIPYTTCGEFANNLPISMSISALHDLLLDIKRKVVV